MVNPRELLINVVTFEEPKTLTGFSQTALQWAPGLITARSWAANAGGGKREPNPFGDRGGTG